MESQEISLQIRHFISSVFKGPGLADEDDIFAMGYVNSLFAMELILFIEKEFEIEISDDDLDLKNFRSIKAMTGFVLSKNSRQPTEYGSITD